MKNAVKTGMLALIIINSPSYALNPIQGLYGGILLGVNYTPSDTFTLPPDTVAALNATTTNPTFTGTAKVTYNTMGAIAGILGYRCNKLRFEGEFLYNNSPYKSLSDGGVIIDTQDTVNEFSGYRLEGATNSGAAMFNTYYDFLPSDPTSNTVPYLGIGIGYSYVSTSTDVYYNMVQVEDSRIKEQMTSPAAQAIIGASYFLDDFTAFGLDVRYLRSTKTLPVFDQPLQVFTLNFSFNGAFNLG